MSTPRFAVVGSRTTRERQARGEGLVVFACDADGTLRERVQVLPMENPSYQCLSADGLTLYTVHGDREQVSALRVDPRHGGLTPLNTEPTGGLNPVHLTLAPGGRHLVVVNHLRGGIAVLPLREDGSLAPRTQQVQTTGQPGPHRQEQPHAKPHFGLMDPPARHLWVPDKGLDQVFRLRWTGEGFTPEAVPALRAREGAGPRHLAFHPTRPWVVVVNELDSSVSLAALDAEAGTLDHRQILSTLPDTFTGFSRAAAVLFGTDGRHVFASNRGHDSVACFVFDEPAGRLRWQGCVPSGGRTPRFMTLTPDGRHLLVLNEDDDRITRFAIGADGLPVPVGEAVACASPVCLTWLP
jgi:6-phosphogluconolactonase (cycloisomerase 2 family)